MRRKKPEKEANHERWLVSYADFITLLFAFFTTLYAISTVDAQKMGKLVTSMKSSFDSNLFAPGSNKLSLNPGAGNGPAAREVLQALDLRNMNKKDTEAGLLVGAKSPPAAKRELLGGEALGHLKKRLEAALPDEFVKGKVRTHIEPRGLVISLGEAGMFDSGSDQIKPEGRELLNAIASSLVLLDNRIRVEGHTDNVPISNSRFPSNWELSTARATAMISYLIVRFGLKPDLLSAAGYAEYHPAASNDTEEGRAINRRVDIVVLNPTAAQIEPK